MLRLRSLCALFAPAIVLVTVNGGIAADPKQARPIEALDTVMIEDMTWMEVRDALAAGKKTVIVATGGVEQNGPYLATGKHNVILRATTNAIARKLGNALVAPIVGFVPEGRIEPPSQHMKFPGTVSLSEETYEALLTDICRSMRTHGFERIVMIGDSGGNQDGMQAVAEKLTKAWQAEASKVKPAPRLVYIPEYYAYDVVNAWLKKQGIKEVDEGYHDSFVITAQMMFVDPSSVRMQQRIAAGKFKINGIDLAPAEKTIEWGRKIVDFRAAATVAAIDKQFAAEKVDGK